MAKEESGKVLGSMGWIIAIAAMLLSLMTGVFLLGWNARGQTATMVAIEVRTVNLEKNFNFHCETQREETLEIQEALSVLKTNEAVQTTILASISRKLRLE